MDIAGAGDETTKQVENLFYPETDKSCDVSQGIRGEIHNLVGMCEDFHESAAGA